MNGGRRPVFFSGLLVLGLLMPPHGTASGSEANALYQAGDYKGAVEAYQKILESGEPTAAIYYNLGNASFRAGQKGMAVLYYERALRLSPRDADSGWNLNILRSALADRLETPDRDFFVTWGKKAVNYFSINEISLIFCGLSAAWALVNLLIFFFPRLRAWGNPLSVLIFLLWFAAAGLFGLKWLEEKAPRIVILDKEVFARYGPSDKETKAFLLHEGAEAKWADESKKWIYIVLPDKSTGWIPRDSCEVI